MPRRPIVLVIVVAIALVTACGTRVDEAATPQTILVPVGGGGATGTTLAGVDDLTAGGLAGTGTAGPGGANSSGGGGTAGAPGASGGPGGAAAVRACPGGATGDPIQLGSVGTRSGIVGAALENAFRGLVVWQEWVNSRGGIQCRPVKITITDDGADPGKHATAVRRQILETRVVNFIGNIAPFTFSAGAGLLEQHNVSAIGGDGGEAGWFRSPNAFPISGTNVARSAPAAKWSLEHLPQRKAAVFYVNEADAPKQLAGNFMKAWKAGGGQVVYEAGVSLAAPDFTSEIVQARDRGADIIFIVLEKAACNRFFDGMRRQNWKPVVLSSACAVETFAAQRELLANHTYAIHSMRPILGDLPAEQEIRAAIARTDPSLPPDGAFMFAWTAGKLLEEAMAQPGAVLTPAGVIDALHRLSATTLNSLIAPQAWPPGAHPEGRCGMVSKFDGTRQVNQTPEFVCN